MAKGSTIAIIVLLAIIVVGGGIAASVMINGNHSGGQQTPTQPTPSGSGLYIDPSAGEYVAPTQAPQKPNVIMPGWVSMTIPANTTEVPVDFYNPEKNEGNYYLTFELRLGDEVLYKSGLVEPGKHIQKITISRTLSPGTYDASVFMQPYTLDENMAPVNNANVKITLKVV